MRSRSLAAALAGALLAALAVAGPVAPARAGAADQGQPSLEAAPRGAAETPRDRPSGAIGFFVRGGIFMWPLLFCAVLALGTIGERLVTFQKAQTDTRKLMASLVRTLHGQGVEPAKDLCVRTRGPIAAILHAGLTKVGRGPAAVEKAIDNAGAIELAYLQRRLIVLNTVAGLAPLLGFLGTVSGMIHAFDVIGATGRVGPGGVAGGIAEALITTVAGLVVAIPAQGMYNYFLSRIDQFVIEMEQSSVELLEVLSEIEG
jgi:biopolymer transport protein ExbB